MPGEITFAGSVLWVAVRYLKEPAMEKLNQQQINKAFESFLDKKPEVTIQKKSWPIFNKPEKIDLQKELVKIFSVAGKAWGEK